MNVSCQPNTDIERKLLMGGFVEVQASASSSQDTVQSVTVSGLNSCIGACSCCCVGFNFDANFNHVYRLRQRRPAGAWVLLSPLRKQQRPFLRFKLMMTQNLSMKTAS